MDLSRVFWLIAVIASVATAAAMAAALFFFTSRPRAVSGSNTKRIVFATTVEKLPAVINNLYTFAMVSSIAYLLFLLFNHSPDIFTPLAVVLQCLFLIIFRSSGFADRLQWRCAADGTSRDLIGGSLSDDRSLLVMLSFLQAGSCISLICAGIGD